MVHPSAAFQDGAGQYDKLRRRLIPPFDAFYTNAVKAMDLCRSTPERVLDLGAGTGLLSEYVLAAYPQTELTLLDGAPAMLEQASRRLGRGVRCVVGDLNDPLPPGPWGAIVSALAIHHLEDEDKRRLFERINRVLLPGGVFVNAEQVAGPTARLDEYYNKWHREAARRLGIATEQWQEAQTRMRLDRCASLEKQLQWLRESGFINVDCLFKEYRFAVIVGVCG